MISFSNVNKKFTTPEGDIHILKESSIDINKWDFIALMWPSGIWKTTFLHMIAGLAPQDTWDIIVDTTPIKEMNKQEATRRRGKHISFIFQQFHLLPQLRVKENIDLVIELNDLERRFTTQEILTKVWLEDRGNAFPDTLSGGEQQRVAIARAFVGKTPILLADEPTGNLDQLTAKRVMELMTSLHKEVRNTIVMITHDPLIARYADKTYYFEEQSLQLKS